MTGKMAAEQLEHPSIELGLKIAMLCIAKLFASGADTRKVGATWVWGSSVPSASFNWKRVNIGQANWLNIIPWRFFEIAIRSPPADDIFHGAKPFIPRADKESGAENIDIWMVPPLYFSSIVDLDPLPHRTPNRPLGRPGD